MICLSFHLNERACVESSSAKKKKKRHAGCLMSGGCGGCSSHQAQTSPSSAGAGKIHLFYLNAH